MTVLILRMPFACLIIMILIFIYYKHRKELPSHISVLFKLLLYCCCFHLVFQGITEYTVNNRDKVPDALNYVLHIFFELTVLWAAFLLNLYIISSVEIRKNKKLISEKNIAYWLVTISSIGIIFAPMTYVDTPQGSFAQGAKAYFLYAGVVLLITNLSICFVRNKKYISPEQYFGLRLTGIAAFSLTAVQIIFPYILLTGLVITLVTLIPYLALENPDVFYNGSNNMFNERAFRRILRERLLIGKKHDILLVTMKPDDSADNNCVTRQAEYLRKTFEKKYNMDIFSITDTMYIFVSSDIFRKKTNISEINVKSLNLFSEHLEIYSEVISFAAFKNDYNTILDHIEDIKMQFINEEIHIDSMTGVYNRNRYELDIVSIKANSTSCYAVFVDVNGLKYVNDNFGHNAGDTLIIETAKILIKAFTGLGQIYRMGGDEFTIIYFGSIPIEQIIDSIKQASEIRTTELEIPISFAVGYAFSESGENLENALKTADSNMYRDKLKSEYHR